MKKLLLISAIASGLFSLDAAAKDSVYQYQSKRYQVEVTCVDKGSCDLKIWNSPKKLGEGEPDLFLTGSNWKTNQNGCPGKFIAFRGNGMFIELKHGLTRSVVCDGRTYPQNAIGQLWITDSPPHWDQEWLFKP